MGALGAAQAQKAVGQNARFEKGIEVSTRVNFAPIFASTWAKTAELACIVDFPASLEARREVRAVRTQAEGRADNMLIRACEFEVESQRFS
jgi:hypothetical protein